MNPGKQQTLWTDRIAGATWFLAFLASFLIAAELISWMVAVATGIVMLCSYLLIRKTSAPFDVSRLTISSFWYATYLAMIFFPAFFVFADQEGSSRVRYLFAVESVLITVPLGALCASRFLSFRREETSLYFDGPMRSPQVPDSFVWKFVLLLGVAVLLTGFYLRDVGTIPLFYLFSNSGDADTLASLREDSFKLLDSPLMYTYFLVRGTLYPVLVMVSFGAYASTRRRTLLMLFFLTLTAGVFFASLSLAKMPVAAVFLVLGFFIYFYRNRTITFRKAAAFFCLIFLFPVIVITFVYADNDFRAPEVTKFIADRLFYGPSEVVYYYFEVFPDHVGYLHGRSIGRLSWLLGWKYFDTPNVVGRYGWPEGLETINANGAFISDLNADFGLAGVVLGGVVAGAIMQLIHVHLIRRRKTIFGLACYAFMVYEFWDLNSISLPTLLASNGTLFALAFLWMMEKWVFQDIPQANREPRLTKVTV